MVPIFKTCLYLNRHVHIYTGKYHINMVCCFEKSQEELSLHGLHNAESIRSAHYLKSFEQPLYLVCTAKSELAGTNLCCDCKCVYSQVPASIRAELSGDCLVPVHKWAGMGGMQLVPVN